MSSVCTLTKLTVPGILHAIGLPQLHSPVPYAATTQRVNTRILRLLVVRIVGRSHGKASLDYAINHTFKKCTHVAAISALLRARLHNIWVMPIGGNRTNL